jgi:CIC family chloride channel protein
LAAAFNAPLAGFVFVIEELRREMSPMTYAGALIAAICADIVTRAMNGQLPSFHVENAKGLPLAALPAVALLGVLMGLVSVVWNRALVDGSALVREQGHVPRWLVVGLVAMGAGLLGWWVPEALGGGHGVAEEVLKGNMATRALAAMLVLLGAKFALTVASYDSGAPGGIFAPMLVIGALCGEVFGRAVEAAMPGTGIEARAMAVMGMAALFSGSVRAPLTGIVLILEMTGNYEQLFAIAVACLAAYLVAEGLKDKPVYEALLESDLTARGLGEARAEPVRVVMSVQHDSALENRTLREAKFPKGCLVVGIERRGLELLPTPDTRLKAGDHVTVLAPGEDPRAALEVMEMCRGA